MMILRLLALLVGLYATNVGAAMCDVRTSTPTFTDLTAMGLMSCDTAGNQRVTLGTLLSGEDQTNNVMRVEGQFSYSGPQTADAQIKASAGFLHTLTCNSDAAATAGSLDIYDNTAGSGTKIHSITFGTGFYPPATMIFDVAFSTGLYLDFTTTADVTCTASYR